jgi:thiol:disulfide interchange protein DsbG
MRSPRFRFFTFLFLLTVTAGWSSHTTAEEAAKKPLSARQRLAQSMLTDIQQTTWFSEGKGPHIVYIFFDPNCPFCHRLYLNTRSWVKQNKLELRWIPVGILTTTSAGKALSILQAKDPLTTFYENEDHYDQGGAIDEDLATPSTEKQLKANEALLARTRLGAVPVMLFHDRKGTPTLIAGSPPKNKLKVIFANVK